MPNDPASSKRREVSTREIKALILVIALTFTLGLWGVFSRQLFQQAANTAVQVESQSSASSAGMPASQPVEGLVINYPPLPTLVPYTSPEEVGLDPNTLTGQPATTASEVKPAAPAVVPSTGKILLGGAAPQISQGGRPVTRTRSSH